MTDNQRIILGDALETLDLLRSCAKIKDARIRADEMNELAARIKDDIRTVFRLDRERS